MCNLFRAVYKLYHTVAALFVPKDGFKEPILPIAIGKGVESEVGGVWECEEAGETDLLRGGILIATIKLGLRNFSIAYFHIVRDANQVKGLLVLLNNNVIFKLLD